MHRAARLKRICFRLDDLEKVFPPDTEGSVVPIFDQVQALRRDPRIRREEPTDMRVVRDGFCVLGIAFARRAIFGIINAAFAPRGARLAGRSVAELIR